MEKFQTLSQACILVVSLIGATACDDGVTIPELPKGPRNERPGRSHPVNADRGRAKGADERLLAAIMTGTRPNTIVLMNGDRFPWTPIDDLQLGVHLYTPTVPDGRYRPTEHNVRVRCALPKTIASGQSVEISLDACVSEPYPVERGSRVTNFRVIAREGHIATGIEPSVEIGQ